MQRSATTSEEDAAQQHHEWAPLSFLERLRIIRDATRALIYLHEASPGGGKGVVLHRDVKPTNILLDAHLNAKLADVDLATEATAIAEENGKHAQCVSSTTGRQQSLSKSGCRKNSQSQNRLDI